MLLEIGLDEGKVVGSQQHYITETTLGQDNNTESIKQFLRTRY